MGLELVEFGCDERQRGVDLEHPPFYGISQPDELDAHGCDPRLRPDEVLGEVGIRFQDPPEAGNIESGLSSVSLGDVEGERGLVLPR